MYFVTQFIIEFGYLIIRVSMSGALSMATTDFLDFLTLAVPLFFMCFEVLEISNFILDHNPKDNRSNSKSLKWGCISIGTIVSVVGGVVIGICVYKGFIQGCPSADPTESIDLVESEAVFGEIYKLQHGVFEEGYCYAWVFNLLLSPGCSCWYLALQPLIIGNQETGASTCAGLSQNNHAAIKPFFPYLEHVRFLFINSVRHEYSGETNLCRMLVHERDFELVSNWTYLRVLRWTGFPAYQSNSTIPTSWHSLQNLVSVDLSAGEIKLLYQATLDSWPLLESFTCMPCPSLNHGNAFADATLPRLREVQMYGVDECISLPEHVNLACVPREDPPNVTCKGMPEWYLRSFLDVAQQTQTTKCTQPACSQYFHDFDQLDKDDNGVLDIRELGVMNYNRRDVMGLHMDSEAMPDWKSEQVECSVREIMRAIPFPINSSGYELSHGWPMVVFLAADLRYTMCTDCAQFQEEFDTRYSKFMQDREKAGASGMSAECQKIQQGGLPFEKIAAACETQRTTCASGLCSMMSMILIHDADFDLSYDVPELETVAVVFALTGMLGDTEVTYECMRQHAPQCFDAANGTKPSLGSVLVFGGSLFDWPVDDSSRCTECPDYLEHAAKATTPDP